MGTTSSANLMAGVNFTLLGTKLNMGFEKTDEGSHYFVFQDLSSPNGGASIGELIDDVKRLMGGKDVPGLTPEEIKNKLTVINKPGSAFNIDDVRIRLTTVYLDIRIDKDDKKTTEYAFRLDIIAGGLLPPDIKLVNIDTITIAVWNTTNEKIKKQLAVAAAA